jgi:hypothetical protein
VEWLGPFYKGSELRRAESGVYVAHVGEPPKGWTAFFVELVYPGAKKKYPLHFTTAVRILPDSEPYPAPVPSTTKLEETPNLLNRLIHRDSRTEERSAHPDRREEQRTAIHGIAFAE